MRLAYRGATGVAQERVLQDPRNGPAKGGELQMLIRSTLTRLLARIRPSDEEGQGLAEYALILALIAIVAIVALIFMGSQVSSKLSIIGSQLSSVAP